MSATASGDDHFKNTARGTLSVHWVTLRRLKQLILSSMSTVSQYLSLIHSPDNRLVSTRDSQLTTLPGKYIETLSKLLSIYNYRWKWIAGRF